MPNPADQSYLYLTTTGRRSGLPREVEIWFTSRNGRYYIIAEYATSDWLRNLQACPHVEVRLGEQRFPATARVINSQQEPELHGAVQQLSREKYGWGGGIVVELKPEAPPS
jgi:deazaflavin-dependent oxidoreductase (nitroreductase family)